MCTHGRASPTPNAGLCTFRRGKTGNVKKGNAGGQPYKEEMRLQTGELFLLRGAPDLDAHISSVGRTVRFFSGGSFPEPMGFAVAA